MLLALAASQAGCGSSSHEGNATAPAPGPGTATTAAQGGQETVCTSEQGEGIVADFGHRSTSDEAQQLATQAETVGFKGVVVQRRACDDYAVVLPGLKTVAQGRELEREARSVGLKVSVDCRSHPVQGGMAAVFGHRRTRSAALALRREAESAGFQNLQVQQDQCDDGEVDLYGLQTPEQRKDFAKEAASVGLHVTFEPG